MVLLIEVVSLLLFVAAAGSEVVWPWATGGPYFPTFRPSVRKRRKEEAAFLAAERELAKVVEERRRVEALGGRDER